VYCSQEISPLEYIWTISYNCLSLSFSTLDCGSTVSMFLILIELMVCSFNNTLITFSLKCIASCRSYVRFISLFGEISCEQYTVLLGLNANQERNYETIALNFYIYKKRQYPAKTATSISPWWVRGNHLPLVSKGQRKSFFSLSRSNELLNFRSNGL
jgi:hypothetical protein